jgi:4-hydroxyphenylpyruvate dioxygenase-like putative hemolysin
MEHGMTAAQTSAIEGIDAITYSTDRWDDARRFLGDWGLKSVSDDASCQVWETLNGAQVQVRRPDDAGLPPPMEAGPTMRAVTWGVTDAQALEPIARALQAAPGFEDRRAQDGTLVALDPHGLGLVFQVSR